MTETAPTYEELRARFAAANVLRQVKALADASGYTEAEATAILGRLAEKGWVLVDATTIRHLA